MAFVAGLVRRIAGFDIGGLTNGVLVRCAEAVIAPLKNTKVTSKNLQEIDVVPLSVGEWIDSVVTLNSPVALNWLRKVSHDPRLRLI